MELIIKKGPGASMKGVMWDQKFLLQGPRCILTGGYREESSGDTLCISVPKKDRGKSRTFSGTHRNFYFTNFVIWFG